MAGLGYEHYGVQGGDIGSMVACHMADLFPANVTGLHVNFLAFPDLGPPDMSSVRPEVRAKVGLGGGYGEIQRTRPQSIGFLLDDSPAGLAGWIVDKFREWSDCKGDIEQSFTKDQLLTNIMIYWINGAGTSAARLYWEIREFGSRVPSTHISVPTGVANFPAEVAKPQRENVAERFNLVHWTELPRGGHFAAMEEPEFFAQDVRTFFRLIR
jgi:microsomal epoxide hydrolase